MTHRGTHFARHRLLVLIGTITVVASVAVVAWHWTMLAAFAVLAIYLLWPDEPAPEDAHTYDRWAAIRLPDILAYTLFGTFLAIPIAAGRGDDVALHPSAYLLWPFALLFLALPTITWRRASFQMEVSQNGFRIDDGWRNSWIGFDQITSIEPWRRDLLGGVRWLAPFLVGAGQFGAAGAILVSRASQGLRIHVKGRPDIVIPGDGLNAGTASLISAAKAHGVRFSVPKARTAPSPNNRRRKA